MEHTKRRNLRTQLLRDADFEAFDELHYEVENKLRALIGSIESKRATGDWQDSLPINPQIHYIHVSTALPPFP